MSIAEIERFVADLKSDARLRAEAEKLQPDKSLPIPLAAVVSFATSKGYGFAAEEMMSFAKAAKGVAQGKSLTNAELDSIAGGGSGGIISLVANGAQDVYLTRDPQITFFTIVYS
jgi:hypothetical protein